MTTEKKEYVIVDASALDVVLRAIEALAKSPEGINQKLSDAVGIIYESKMFSELAEEHAHEWDASATKYSLEKGDEWYTRCKYFSKAIRCFARDITNA